MDSVITRHGGIHWKGGVVILEETPKILIEMTHYLIHEGRIYMLHLRFNEQEKCPFTPLFTTSTTPFTRVSRCITGSPSSKGTPAHHTPIIYIRHHQITPSRQPNPTPSLPSGANFGSDKRRISCQRFHSHLHAKRPSIASYRLSPTTSYLRRKNPCLIDRRPAKPWIPPHHHQNTRSISKPPPQRSYPNRTLQPYNTRDVNF